MVDSLHLSFEVLVAEIQVENKVTQRFDKIHIGIRM